MLPALTDDEIALLCRPLKQPAAQCRFLERMGLRVRRRPDGTPLVLRADVEKLAHTDRPANGPRWSK
jgi:hypothetical protein